MVQSDQFSEIVGYLVATAKAHHAATGGVNTRWAKWYAEHVLDDLNGALDADLETEELEAWLIDADDRYRNEPQTKSWSKAYADWLLAEHR